MIHFFPGLFCNQSMWDPYLELDSYCCYDLKDADSIHLHIKPSDTLIGYSMGGRVALEIAKKLNFQIKNLILLSSHPGISNSERPSRKRWEDEIIQKMKHLNKDAFIEFWDSLEIFSTSKSDKTISDDTFNENVDLFIRNRLSEQFNYMDDLILHKDKVLYLYGSKDEKYSLLGRQLNESGINSIEVEADHRVHLKADQLISIIKKEIKR